MLIAIFGLSHLSLSLSFSPSLIAYGQSPEMANPQMKVSNFVAVPIEQHLGDNKNDIFAPGFPFRGDISNTFNFTIDTPNPVGQSYLLIQIFGSYSQGHTININGQNVTSPQGILDNIGDGNWATLTVIMDDGILKSGSNNIQILRNIDSPDNFLIDNIVVNWQYPISQ
jgi:hypothetical protein